MFPVPQRTANSKWQFEAVFGTKLPPSGCNTVAFENRVAYTNHD